MAAGECDAAITHLPSLDEADSSSAACKVDLHGCSAPVAAAALAFVLRAFRRTAAVQGGGKEVRVAGPARGLMIITGRGLHSEERLQPVLRPQICGLLDELAPPLRWALAEGNDGCVLVSAEEIAAWCAQQT